jgi:hypothetical protein
VGTHFSHPPSSAVDWSRTVIRSLTLCTTEARELQSVARKQHTDTAAAANLLQLTDVP